MTDDRSDDEDKPDPLPPLPDVEPAEPAPPPEDEPAQPPLPPEDEPEPVPGPAESLFLDQRTARAAPVQLSTPQNWPLARVPAPAPVARKPMPMPIGPPPPEPVPPPLPPGARAPAPAPSRRRKRLTWPARIAMWGVKAVAVFVLGSVLWVGAYRFIAPPVTLTMVGDMIGGHRVAAAWMPLSRIDPDMARAAIAAEDGNFCIHNGFDFAAIAKAFARNQQGGRIRGGSTISQQTAKNVFLWQGGGYFRKGLEAWFTFLIENLWGKRRIMEVYLNVAETGIATYGVNAGAMRYFRHDASKLTEREAAQIAAVLPLPKKRAGISPKGFTRRYGTTIDKRIDVVRGSGYDACLR